MARSVRVQIRILLIAENMRKTHVQMKLPNTEFEEYRIYFAIYLAVKGKI